MCGNSMTKKVVQEQERTEIEVENAYSELGGTEVTAEIQRAYSILGGEPEKSSLLSACFENSDFYEGDSCRVLCCSGMQVLYVQSLTSPH